MTLVRQVSLLVHDMHDEGVRYRTEMTALDETYIKVKGTWTYLYRAVDSLGQCHRLPALGAA